VTTLVNNGDGTYTYTSEDGTITNVDVPADIVNQFDNIVNNGPVTVDGNTYNTIEEYIQHIVEATETVTTLVYEATTGIATYTNEEGTPQTIDLSAVVKNFETLTSVSVDNTAGTLTYVDEKGNTNVLNLGDLVKAQETVTNLVYEATTGIATYTNEEGVDQTIDLSAVVKNFETLTSVSVDNAAGTLTYVDEEGNPTVLNIADIIAQHETLTTLAYNTTNNELTYTGENGTPVVFNLNEGSIAYTAATNVLTYTDEAGVITPLNLNNTGLTYDVATKILSYVNTLGVTQTVDLSAIVAANETVTTLVDNADGTYTYTSEDDTETIIKPIDYEYTVQETGKQWISDKPVYELVADITLVTANNTFTLPATVPTGATVIGVRFISKANGSISTNVIQYDSTTRKLVLGTIGSFTVLHPAGDYYLIVEYAEN